MKTKKKRVYHSCSGGRVLELIPFFNISLKVGENGKLKMKTDKVGRACNMSRLLLFQLLMLMLLKTICCQPELSLSFMKKDFPVIFFTQIQLKKAFNAFLYLLLTCGTKCASKSASKCKCASDAIRNDIFILIFCF